MIIAETFTAIDFETTGSVPGWPVEPWQIGMASISPVDGVGDLFSSYLSVSVDRPFNRFAPGRHSLIRDELALSPTLPEVWDNISLRLVGKPLVAHNIGTERTILRKTAPLHRLGPWVDTLRLAKIAYPGLSSYALEELMPVLGLTDCVREICPELEAHDALYDAVACGVLFMHIVALPGWERISLDDIAIR